LEKPSEKPFERPLEKPEGSKTPAPLANKAKVRGSTPINALDSPRMNMKKIVTDFAPKERSTTPTGQDKVKELKDGFELDKNILKTNLAQIEENPLAMRIFTHVAQTSTAIQVAWSHPVNFQKVIKTKNEDGTVIM
jgi:hypothetical protein